MTIEYYGLWKKKTVRKQSILLYLEFVFSCILSVFIHIYRDIIELGRNVSTESVHPHTHTHTHTYIYIYWQKCPDHE